MINLVSQEVKRQLRANARNRALMASGVIMAAIIIMGFAMALPSLIALRYLAGDLSYAREAEERSSVKRDLEERTEALIDFESRARGVLSRARKAPSFEDMLRETTRAAPDGIDLLVMRFDEKTFDIDGHYQHRASFLAFLEALKTNSFIKDVASPLSNLLKETDASFNITLSL